MHFVFDTLGIARF